MRLRMLLFLALCFPFLGGWGHWGPTVKIGLSLDRSQGREILVDKLKVELEENRAELVLRDAQGDPAAQEAQVRDLISKGVQALVMVPCDPSKAEVSVKAAHQAGIKVISLERLIPGDLDYLIRFNELKAGELQAQAMLKKVPRGSYVLLGADSGFREGQMKTLQPLIDGGEIRIAASRVSKGTETPGAAAQEVEAVLKTQGNKVDAILASDGSWTLGAAQALEKAGLSGKVSLAGVGEDLETCRRVVSGTETLTVYHAPRKLAEETAYLAAKLARKANQFSCQFTEVENAGSKTPAVLLSPVTVDSKNLESTILEDKVQKKEEVYKGRS